MRIAHANAGSRLTGGRGRSLAGRFEPRLEKRPPLAGWLLAAAVALKLALHVTTAVITPYGLHRDEFLYLAMGSHLQLWGMDFPPAMAVLSQIMRATVGVDLISIRLVPALASTFLVVFAALSARELGGRRFAQGLAALAVIASPAFLRTGTLFQPVVFDQLAWTLVLFALIKLARDEDARWWLAVGVAGGFGLLVKFSIGIIAAGVVVALLVLPERHRLTPPRSRSYLPNSMAHVPRRARTAGHW